MSNEQKTQQHTPGPWKVYFDDVYKEGEPVIEGVSVIGVPDEDGDEIEQIAYIINDSVDDAHLIAAAPELLAALKGLTRALDGVQPSGPVYLSITEIDAIRAAIEKAEAE